MTLHFAAARRADSSPVARILGGATVSRPGNDNGDRDQPLISDSVEAALRHFANYGLGAAAEAMDRAQKAHACGNEAEFDHWRDICRMLDSRAAKSLVSTP